MWFYYSLSLLCIGNWKTRWLEVIWWAGGVAPHRMRLGALLLRDETWNSACHFWKGCRRGGWKLRASFGGIFLINTIGYMLVIMLGTSCFLLTDYFTLSWPNPTILSTRQVSKKKAPGWTECGVLHIYTSNKQ